VEEGQREEVGLLEGQREPLELPLLVRKGEGEVLLLLQWLAVPVTVTELLWEGETLLLPLGLGDLLTVAVPEPLLETLGEPEELRVTLEQALTVLLPEPVACPLREPVREVVPQLVVVAEGQRLELGDTVPVRDTVGEVLAEEQPVELTLTLPQAELLAETV
jgi:hypothetical protein